MATRAPDMFVWLGDIIYADKPIFAKWRVPASVDDIASQYAMQRARPEYAAFLAHGGAGGTPPLIVGVWDDHDLGVNDADERVPASFLNASQALLQDFLNVPEDSPLRTRIGAYSAWDIEVPKTTMEEGTSGSSGAAVRGGLGRARLVGEGGIRTANKELRLRVRLILLDVRTHRSPWGEASHDMLGPAQWAWLEGALKDSVEAGAAVTLIGSGIQVLAPGDPPVTEGWGRAPAALAKLVALLGVTRTRGAFLLSGDVHFGELNVAEGARAILGYPLWEFTSSGLTHSWGGLVKASTAAALLVGSTRAPLPAGEPWTPGSSSEPISACASDVPWRTFAWAAARAVGFKSPETGLCFYAGRNWGEVDIQLDDGADGGDAVGVVRMRLWGEDGAVRLKHEVPLADLVPASHKLGKVGAGAGAGAGSLSDAQIAACARADLSAGVTRECAALLAALLPRIGWGSALRHVGAHSAILVGALVGLAAMLTGPPLLLVLAVARAPKLLPFTPPMIAKAAAVAAVAIVTTLLLTPPCLFVAESLMT